MDESILARAPARKRTVFNVEPGERGLRVPSDLTINLSLCGNPPNRFGRPRPLLWVSTRSTAAFFDAAIAIIRDVIGYFFAQSLSVFFQIECGDDFIAPHATSRAPPEQNEAR